MSISLSKRIHPLQINAEQWTMLTSSTPGVTVNLITELHQFILTETGLCLGLDNSNIYYIDITKQQMDYTAETKLDIIMTTADQINCVNDNILGFLPLNDDNQLRILSIGSKPTHQLNITCILKEIEVKEPLHLTYFELQAYTHEYLSQYKHGYIG